MGVHVSWRSYLLERTTAKDTIIVFSPCLILFIFLLIRRSFGFRSGWIYLCVFCLLRLVGDSLQLATETSSNSHNDCLMAGAAICSAIGLGPLFLTTTSLLLQCNAFVHTKAVSNQTHRALVTFDLCTLVATVTAIAGGVQSFKPAGFADGFHPKATFEAAIAIYAATWACIACSAVVIAARQVRFIGPTIERRRFESTVWAILFGLTMLLVRVVYALLFTFDRAPKWSPFDGDETIQLCMQVFEEWVVTLLYLLVGFAMLRMIPPAREAIHGRDTASRFEQVARYIPIVHWFVR